MAVLFYDKNSKNKSLFLFFPFDKTVIGIRDPVNQILSD